MMKYFYKINTLNYLTGVRHRILKFYNLIVSIVLKINKVFMPGQSSS